MKKSSLVKLSLATVVAAVAFSITPNEESHASASMGTLRKFDGNCCSGSGGNCLNTVIVRPRQK
jgi:hypothetical protein